ncbi:Haloacid dehalogenase domain protein hydrolase [Terriglobus saanensis SP1PR4]|uniref:Haloacid dehalogenase domain protein hydrolase n=2 Tax=Terriglobus saanensis TaxID=870903 RepID=E8V5U3_TERSS|nr:Haloacid dehalogenase domain protein hydrolase [Terriglobus saanensis SP1PR4]
MRMLPSPTFDLPAVGQTLMIDADDTLWENNHLFDRAIASFVTFLDHKTHTPDEVRDHLNRIEHDRVRLHGYGLASFRKSLVICFEELSGEVVTEAHRTEIDRFTALITESPIELLPEVDTTLAYLAGRHRLLLVTKGAEEEQVRKLERSGLADYFDGVEVLSEKHVEAYLELRHRHACEAATTWMIGNSPKSDVNPALAAGLNAVLVPHANTWVLEHEKLSDAPEGQRLLTVDRFTDLRLHF